MMMMSTLPRRRVSLDDVAAAAAAVVVVVAAVQRAMASTTRQHDNDPCMMLLVRTNAEKVALPDGKREGGTCRKKKHMQTLLLMRCRPQKRAVRGRRKLVSILGAAARSKRSSLKSGFSSGCAGPLVSTRRMMHVVVHAQRRCHVRRGERRAARTSASTGRETAALGSPLALVAWTSVACSAHPPTRTGTRATADPAADSCPRGSPSSPRQSPVWSVRTPCPTAPLCASPRARAQSDSSLPRQAAPSSCGAVRPRACP
jgi:hypothetical protein